MIRFLIEAVLNYHFLKFLERELLVVLRAGSRVARQQLDGIRRWDIPVSPLHRGSVSFPDGSTTLKTNRDFW